MDVFGQIDRLAGHPARLEIGKDGAKQCGPLNQLPLAFPQAIAAAQVVGQCRDEGAGGLGGGSALI